MTKALFGLSFLLLAGCQGSPTVSNPAPQSQGMVAAMSKMGQLATDPIAQMSFEFEGNPAQDQIREKLDPALEMYRLEANNENRGNAGRVLISLRKEGGHSEMSILDRILSSPAEGGTFEEAARRISAVLSQ